MGNGDYTLRVIWELANWSICDLSGDLLPLVFEPYFFVYELYLFKVNEGP